MVEETQQRMNRRQLLGMASAVGAGAVALGVATRLGANAAPNAQDAGTPSASPVASPAATPAVAAGVTVQTLDTLKFDPAAITIPANTDTVITITNNGVLQHDFVIDALSIKTDLLDGGASATVTINAAAGTYEYYCSVVGHKEAGMVGTLTVQ